MQSRRTPKSAIAWFCLSLLVLIEVASGHQLILCRAPGEHVAIEDSRASALCHAAQEASTTQASTFRGASSPDCVDTPIPQTWLGQALGQSSAQPIGSLLLVISLPWSLPVPTIAPRSIENPPLLAKSKAARFLRSVVLLV